MLYLVGMNMRARRSMNCIPRKVFTPMNINTPYSTGIGISLERNMMILIVETTTMMLIYLRIGASCVESPTKRKTQMPVILWIGNELLNLIGEKYSLERKQMI